MSKKENKFQPPMGYMVAIDQHCQAVIRLATALEKDPVELGRALESSGYKLDADPFDISADTWKVIAKRLASNADIAESVSELDEEEMEKEDAE